MSKASDIKKGMVVKDNSKLLLVTQIDVQSPSARGAATLYKMRFTDINSGQKVENRFKGDDTLETAELVRASASFSYVDGDDYIFMNSEDFTQYTFNKSDIEDALLFINEETEGLVVLIVDEKPIGIEVPQTVVLQISETDPSIKGASAAARTKPARFTTGLTIQVPEYISRGERVKINTSDQSFISRA